MVGVMVECGCNSWLDHRTRILHGSIHRTSTSTYQQNDQRQRNRQAEGQVRHARPLHAFVGFLAIVNGE
jgi:hypothetical protein